MKNPVKFYKTNHPYSPFEVHYLFEGKKVKKRFKDESEAKAHKEKIEQVILNEGVKGLQIKISEREEWASCMSILEGSQVTLVQAVREWKRAWDILHPLGLSLPQLIKAEEEKRAIHGKAEERIPLPEAVSLFIEEKKQRGRRTNSTINGLKNRLEGIIKNGCNTWEKWNRESLQKAVFSANLSARSEINELAAIRNFSNWCINKGWLPSDPTERIERPKAETPLPQILTPSQFEALVKAAKEVDEQNNKTTDKRALNKNCNYWAYYLVSGLLGLRPSEIDGMILADSFKSRVGEGELKVVHVGKMKDVRSVPIVPKLLDTMNLIEWKFKKPPQKKHQEICKRAGITWENDILRHSFISYRLRITKNLNQVCLEAGNSPSVIQRYYAVVVGTSDSEKWFQVE